MVIITEGLECHTKVTELSLGGSGEPLNNLKQGDEQMYKKADLPHSPRRLLQVQASHVTIRF